MKKKQPTIIDVARLLGISKSTVSRSLRGGGQCKPETILRVKEAARIIGYQPNLIAQGLKTQRTNIIGVIVPDIERPYYASLTSSIQQFALKHNFHTVICQSKDSFETERDVLFTLLSLQVDGILMVHSKETTDFDHIQQVVNRNLPLILIDRSNDTFNIPKVENDHFGGGFMIGQHLAQMGCKKIAIVGGPSHLKMSTLRINGCIAGAQSEGINISMNDIFYGDFNREKTLTILDNILINGRRPDAIFCVYDRGALEILKQLEFRKIAVPDEIAVAGFGNETMSRFVMPALTTVHQDPNELGELSLSILIQQILSDVPVKINDHFIKPEMIIRDSTRKPSPRNIKSLEQEPCNLPYTESTIISMFRKVYGISPVLTVRAPGSIIMVGDHTDYFSGVLLGASINKDMYISLSESPDELYRIHEVRADKLWTGTWDQLKEASNGWLSVFGRIIQSFKMINFPVRPFQLSFGGNIPQKAGLSLKTALQCGALFAINACFDFGLSKSELIRLAQSIEYDDSTMQTGLMNKYACMLGKKGGFIKLDCQSMEFEYIPFPYQKYGLILCDSGVMYGPGGAEVATRIREGMEALEGIREKFPITRSFREVDATMLTAAKGLMRPQAFNRGLYIIETIAGAEKAAAYLEKKQLSKFGRVLYESHHALQSDYQASCPELDFLVNYAAEEQGFIGAKMVGEGFGGSMVTVARKSVLPQLMDQLDAAYAKKFNLNLMTYEVTMCNGVSIISS